MGCGRCEDKSSAGGVIVSPNFPVDYGNDCACVYVIKVPTGKIIELNFTVFSVEEQYDWVHVSNNISLKRVDFIWISNDNSGVRWSQFNNFKQLVRMSRSDRLRHLEDLQINFERDDSSL